MKLQPAGRGAHVYAHHGAPLWTHEVRLDRTPTMWPLMCAGIAFDPARERLSPLRGAPPVQLGGRADTSRQHDVWYIDAAPSRGVSEAEMRRVVERRFAEVRYDTLNADEDESSRTAKADAHGSSSFIDVTCNMHAEYLLQAALRARGVPLIDADDLLFPCYLPAYFDTHDPRFQYDIGRIVRWRA